MMQLMRDSARGTHPPPQQYRVGPYIIKETIGEGATAIVKLAINGSTGEKAAVKIVDKCVARKRKEAKKEIKLLQSRFHGHPNIIELQHVEEDMQRIYIFTEYCELSDLYTYIKQNGVFEENTARKLFVQMVSAIEYCHKKLRICHHDVKLENFCITANQHLLPHTNANTNTNNININTNTTNSNNNSYLPHAHGVAHPGAPPSSNVGMMTLKLIDFGFAVELEDIDSEPKIKVYDGSPAYSSLEVLMKKPHDESVDVYGLGICLYYMLFGCYPFCEPHKTSIEGLIHNIQSNLVHFPRGVSQPACDLILRMLTPKKRNRITVEDIRNHPWLLCVGDLAAATPATSPGGVQSVTHHYLHRGAGDDDHDVDEDDDGEMDAQFTMDYS